MKILVHASIPPCKTETKKRIQCFLMPMKICNILKSLNPNITLQNADGNIIENRAFETLYEGE